MIYTNRYSGSISARGGTQRIGSRALCPDYATCCSLPYPVRRIDRRIGSTTDSDFRNLLVLLLRLLVLLALLSAVASCCGHGGAMLVL